MLNSFWWGNERNGEGVKWMSWERLCVPKCQGGMGFRRLHEFNISFLGKQGWRLLTEPNSLAARVLKGKYYPHTTFLEATIGNNTSYICRSILQGHQVFQREVLKRIRDGCDIMVYRDPWFLGDNPYFTFPMRVGLEELSVNRLLCACGKKWDAVVVNAIFNPLEAELILNIPLSRQSIPDGWMWKWEKRG